MSTAFAENKQLHQYPDLVSRLFTLLGLDDSKGWDEIYDHPTTLINGLNCPALQTILINSLSEQKLNTMLAAPFLQRLIDALDPNHPTAIPHAEQVKALLSRRCPHVCFDKVNDTNEIPPATPEKPANERQRPLGMFPTDISPFRKKSKNKINRTLQRKAVDDSDSSMAEMREKHEFRVQLRMAHWGEYFHKGDEIDDFLREQSDEFQLGLS